MLVEQTESVYFFTLWQDAGWLPALHDHHNHDNRRRKSDAEIKEHESLWNERIQVQGDAHDHAQRTVVEGTGI